uniref:Putative terminase n=1 Tax=viral metagenome TaxID=1070528 RepID=A0A6H2A2H2_9ZZZZ
MGAIDRIRARTTSSRKWIESNLFIKDKRASIVPFRYKPIQIKLDAAVAEQRRQGRPVRIICLKARQQGVSTWTEGRLYEIGRRHPHYSITVIGNELENSNHLYGMYRLFSEREPHPLPFARSNTKGLTWAEPHGSQVVVTTAEKRYPGSGHTNQAVHISELAKWPRPRDTMLSLMQSVPDTPESFAVIETTANGVGNHFHGLWLDARAGRTEWAPVFLAWHEDPEYRRPVDSYPMDGLGEHERYNAYPGQETDLQAKGVDIEQLTWRRWCIDTNCSGELEQFAQEYPSNDTEAFLHSGRPRFSVRILQRWLGQAVEPISKGSLDDAGKLRRGEGDYLHIWDEPAVGRDYVIGADTAEGLKDGDYSAAAVLDSDTKRLVATWHGHVEPDEYAVHLDRVGRYYNSALLAVEANNHGWAVLSELRKLYPRHRLMRRLSTGSDVVESGEKLGWYTNSTNKPEIIGKLAAAIRDEEMPIQDRATIEELMGYLILGGGETGCASGAYDDRVMALAIALMAATHSSAREAGYNAQRNSTAGVHLPVPRVDF